MMNRLYYQIAVSYRIPSGISEHTLCIAAQDLRYYAERVMRDPGFLDITIVDKFMG